MYMMFIVHVYMNVKLGAPKKREMENNFGVMGNVIWRRF